MPHHTVILLLLCVGHALALTFASGSRGCIRQAQAWRMGVVRSVNTKNVLILDHLNINHEKGRHDLVKAFYFDLLGMTPDPRKQENLEAGRKTLWANAGIHQFHLPEG